MTAQTKEPFNSGDIVGFYELTRLLSLGQNKAVYLARHKATMLPVALAALLPHLARDPMQVKRCMHAAKAMARIKHESVVEVYDFGMTDSGLPYIAMKYLEGAPLQAILLQEGTLSAPRIRRLFGQVAGAMEVVHQRNIIHRDLKPSNLIVQSLPEEKVTVIDFHSCRTIEAGASPLTMTGEVVGTPCYMSPEQCLGEPADQRSDVYGLGCCMFEAMSGRKAISGATAVDTMARQISHQPELGKDLDPELKGLSAVVLKCLAKEPKDRYQSMAALQKDLVGAEVKTKAKKSWRNMFS